MANPLYYMHRHAQQVMIENPGMTQERYMEGFDRTNTLVRGGATGYLRRHRRH